MIDDHNIECGLHAENASHAAATWLQRIDADPAAVCVVQIAPKASISIWIPGRQHVGLMAPLDDAAIEVLEAAAPIAQLGLEALDATQRIAVADCVSAGAKLQLLLLPAAGEIVLRLVHESRTVVLGVVNVDMPVH